MFPLISETSQGCPAGAADWKFFNILLEVLPIAIRQKKERKGTEIGKEDIKLSLFTDDMTAYVANLKESTKSLLDEVIITRLQDTRLIYKNQSFS